MLKKNIFELTPNDSITLFERQSKHLTDYCISEDQKNIFAIYHPRIIVGWRTKDLYKFFNKKSTLNELSIIAIKTKYICVASFKSSTVIVMNIYQENQEINLRHRNSNMEYITFSQNSKYLFTLNQDKILSIWNFEREELLIQIQLEQNYRYFIFNQQSIRTTIRMIQRDKQVKKLQIIKGKIGEKTKDTQICFSDGFYLEIFKNTSIKFISLRSQKLIRKKQILMNLSKISFIQKNKLFYVISENDNILFFQTSTMRITGSVQNIYNYKDIIVNCYRNKFTVLGNNLFGLKLWRIQ